MMPLPKPRVFKEVFMEAKEVMLSSLEQSQGYLTSSLDGLTQEEFAWSPGLECNSIAFILWHTTRVEDFFVNRVVQRETELYEVEGWREKLGTPAREMGYQYTVEQLQAWPVPDLATLQGYASSVREKTLAFLKSASAEKLSEVHRPDRSSESIGDVLTRICTEIALHMGQIAYLRGVQRGLDK
jgi:uncharacterized damage-inducible protein DinB